jgi:nucleotide-binding universal stress UspA family protein
MASAPRSQNNATVLVAVTRKQTPEVIVQAAHIAALTGADLICANVEVTHYTLEVRSDQLVSAGPIAAEQDAPAEEVFDHDFAERIAAALTGTEVRWSLRELTGEPAHELARLADEVDAQLIVVGSHQAGLSAATRERLSGSVAMHLAHTQHRPVMVVPAPHIPHRAHLLHPSAS